MAVLALGFAGAAFAGTSSATVAFGMTAAQIGFAVGGTLGGLLDSTLIFPAVFQNKQNQDLSGQRLTDFQVTQASEGSPIAWATGGKNRLGGTVIWIGPLQEVKKKQSGGGKGGGSQSVTSYSYFTDVAIAFCEGPVAAYRRIWADGKLIYDNITSEKADTSMYDSLIGYAGSTTQNPDPTMEAVLGAGNVPGYRGISYVLIKKLALGPFGNRLPQFSAYVEQEANQSLAVAVSRTLNRANRVQNVDYDVDQLPGRIQGMLVANPQAVTAQLEIFLLAYNLGVQEVQGKLVFFPYSNASPIVLDNRDLAAHESGEESPQSIKIVDNTGISLPSEVVVTYYDVDNYFQQGAMRAKNIHAVVPNVSNITVPLTLSADQAKILAKQLLWLAYSQRQTVQLTLPPSYLGKVHESDLIQVTYQGTTFLIKLNEINRGNNYLISCSGTVYDPEVLSQTADPDPPQGQQGDQQTAYKPPKMLLEIADLAPLSDEHLNDYGLYYAGAVLDPTKEYRGAELFSNPNSDGFDDVDNLSQEGVVGKAATVLAAPGDWRLWDRINTVDVVLSQGTLATGSEAKLLAGTSGNFMLVGHEIIGFGTATLTAPNTYRLSNLLRGRRNTQEHVGDHAIGEHCMLLDDSFIQTVAHMNSGNIGTNYEFRLASSGQTVDDVVGDGIVSLTYNAEMRRPFKPANVWGTRDDAGNLTIYWSRRTRALSTALQPFIPLAEEYERYQVEIWDGTPTLLRTEDVYWDDTGDVPNFVYSVADQGTDGFSAFDTINVKVYQVSKSVGRGLPYNANL